MGSEAVSLRSWGSTAFPHWSRKRSLRLSVQRRCAPAGRSRRARRLRKASSRGRHSGGSSAWEAPGRSGWGWWGWGEGEWGEGRWGGPGAGP